MDDLTTLTFRQAFSVESSLYIKLRPVFAYEKRGTFTARFRMSVEISTSGTSRDLSMSIALASLLQDVTRLGALMEGTSEMFVRFHGHA